MALTDAEKQRVGEMLDRLGSYERNRVLSSQQSFEQWLSKVAYSIYCKVRDWMNDLWNWLFG
jgi:ribosomal protein S16